MENQRKIALIAGIGYLAIFITGLFANFFVIERFVVREDASETLARILGNTGLFRIGVLAFVLMVLFDLLLTWALYVFFRPVNERLSSFAATFRGVNVAIFGVALFHLFDVLVLSGQGAYALSTSAEYLQTEVMRSLAAFNYTWLIGLLFFGVHLLALGALALQSGTIPRFIGYLLFLAGVGYLVDSFAQFMLPNYLDYQSLFALIVVVPGVLGELSFTIWLLAKGGRP